MECLLISASPRKGNCETLLRKIAEEIPSELILMREKDIRRCTGCMSCHNTPRCVIDDDMADILTKMRSVETIVIATPNYFANMTGLAKDFVDRTHPCYQEKLLKGKKLILIMVGGSAREKSKVALDNAMYGFVKYQGLNLIGSFAFKDSEEMSVQQIIGLLCRN